jgi:hypothetical protein
MIYDDVDAVVQEAQTAGQCDGEDEWLAFEAGEGGS